jgi:hypothetical protein
VKTDVDEIRFHVSRTGVPVVVKSSFFPNWRVSGADGPWRLAPNLMVVTPTKHDVVLTYGVSGVDWLGRILTVLGIVGLVLLVRWRPGPSRRARDEATDDEPGTPESSPTAALP